VASGSFCLQSGVVYIFLIIWFPPVSVNPFDFVLVFFWPLHLEERQKHQSRFRALVYAERSVRARARTLYNKIRARISPLLATDPSYPGSSLPGDKFDLMKPEKTLFFPDGPLLSGRPNKARKKPWRHHCCRVVDDALSRASPLRCPPARRTISPVPTAHNLQSFPR